MFAAGRAFEQIRNSIAYPLANVKIVGGHTGIICGEGWSNSPGDRRYSVNAFYSEHDCISTQQMQEKHGRHYVPQSK